MSSELEALRGTYGLEGDAGAYLKLANALEAQGKPELAAVAYDRAYGLAPDNDEIIYARQHLLNTLLVVEHGIVFRYISAGTFLMGSAQDEPDEHPVHPVELNAFWIADIPISWAAYCDLMDWYPAPESIPKDYVQGDMSHFMLFQENKIRRQYCENETKHASDWHAHVPEQTWTRDGETISLSQLFGGVLRENPNRPWQYDSKPMVSVSYEAAEDLCQHLSTSSVRYKLPTEAEWEKAARGGLINATYPWGNQPPSDQLCDFNHFGKFFIQPSRHYSPNGYGLYAMSGGVWEWTTDWYDAEFYKHSPAKNPAGPDQGKEKVLRGGSWADSEEAVTVAYRMSRSSNHWKSEDKHGRWGGYISPNIGFRVCRTTVTG